MLALYAWFALLPLRTSFIYRWRGMAHSWGTQVNRLMYGTFIGLEALPICYAWHFPLWAAALVGVFAFIGMIFGHGSEQGTTVTAHEGMAFICMARAFFFLSPLIYFHHQLLWLGLLGALAGFAYWYGYTKRGILNLFGIEWCRPFTNNTPDVSWGEWYTGQWAVGLSLAIAGFWGMLHYA